MHKSFYEYYGSGYKNAQKANDELFDKIFDEEE